MRQKRTKKIPIATALATETPKGKGRQKVVIQEETPVRRSPRMKGKVSKNLALSKTSTKESPVQIVSDHSHPHPKITSISKNPNEECRDEIKENPNDTPADQPGTSSCRGEIVPEKVDPNTALVPHKSTWITDFVEHLW